MKHGSNFHHAVRWSLLAGVLLSACISVAAADANRSPAPGQVLIKWKPNGAKSMTPAAQAQALAGTKLKRSFARSGWHLVELPPDMPVKTAVEYYRRQSNVQHAEPNYPIKLHVDSNDPRAPKLWGLAKIGAPEVWPLLTNATEVVVAVLDTGINYNHPDLAANMWRNPGEVLGNGRDDDNNGYVDDVYGLDVLDADADPMDIDGHGSHVSGIIGAVRNNGQGVVGVHPSVKLIGVRMLSSDTYSGVAQAVEAYEYAIALKERGVNLRVINNSWGGDFPSFALAEVICLASEVGILSVCAAGNDHKSNDFRPSYPTGYSCSGVIAVAASTPSDQLAFFSNHGLETVHLAAPGDGIVSTYKGKPEYGTLSGTSMASPHVSGAAALLFAKQPDLSAEAVKSLLLTSVDRVPAWQNVLSSGGRLNVAAAMKQLLTNAATRTNLTPSSQRVSALRLISRSNDGRIGNDDSVETALSEDGRFVAFTSAASNLVPNDTNGQPDVFLHDRVLGLTSRISVSTTGRQADDESGAPSISADGRFIAFHSGAEPLVAGDGNGVVDVFLYDRVANRLELISVPSSGGLGDGDSGFPSISQDGRYVVFSSDATNLVPDDFNGERDIFLRDRVERRTVRISLPSGGGDANASSDRPVITRDGRLIAFHSAASNLTRADGNNAYDIFVYDRMLASIERVSVSSAGIQGNNDSGYPSLSADGNFVVYQSLASNLTAGDSNSAWDIFLRDRAQGLTRRISVPNGGGQSDEDCFDPFISADGRFIGFTTPAQSLRPSSETSVWDVYLFDRVTGKLSRLLHNGEGLPGADNSVTPKLSRDASSVAFISWAHNLAPGDGNAAADVFVVDRSGSLPDLMIRRAGETPLTGVGIRSEKASQRFSQPVASGGTAIFEFVLENDGTMPEAFLLTGTAGIAGWRIDYFENASGSTSVTGQMTGNGWITPVLPVGGRISGRIEVTSLPASDGRRSMEAQIAVKALNSPTSLDRVQAITVRPFSPPDLFLASRARDGTPGTITSEAPSISADGRYIAFDSDAPTFVANDFNEDTDIFVFDRVTENIERVSATSSGTQGNAMSRDPSLSADGRYVVFSSRATNLVPSDTNNREDIFLKDRTTRAVTRISVASNRAQATGGGSVNPRISSDGQVIIFHSRADNLFSGDTKQSWDVFMHERSTAQTTCVSLTPGRQTGNGDSLFAEVTFDGRYIAFQSHASDLVAGDTNDALDVFLYDRNTRSIELISATAAGGSANGSSGAVSISDDGRHLLFTSSADNLVPDDRNDASDVFLYDRSERKLSRLDPGTQGRGHVLSGNGRWVGFTSDLSESSLGKARAFGGVFLYDLTSRTLQTVTRSRAGQAGDDYSELGAISRDGRFVAVQSWAQNLLGEEAPEAGQILIFDQASFQPDQIARHESEAGYRGADRFGSDGQSVEAPFAAGATKTFFAAVKNASAFPDRFLVTSSGGSALVEIQYFDAASGTSITSQITGSGWDTGELAPGAIREIRIVVLSPNGNGPSVTLRLTAMSANDGVKSDAVSILALADSDNDGLPDDWERQQFGSITATTGASDSDGDGFKDLFEYMAGTHPGLASSFLGVRNEAPQNGFFSLRWPSVANRYYIVERSAGLGEAFLPVSGLLSATPPENTFVDPSAPARIYFYRLRVLPP